MTDLARALSDLLALTEKATPGPRTVNVGRGLQAIVNIGGSVIIGIAHMGDVFKTRAAEDADAAFIAALSPERVRALVEVAQAADRVVRPSNLTHTNWEDLRSALSRLSDVLGGAG